MNSEQLFQALEHHFIALNKIAYKYIFDEVRVFNEIGSSFIQISYDPVAPDKETIESKKNSSKTLSAHRANLELCNSYFKTITDNTPITGMISDMREEQQKMLDSIPLKVPLEYEQGNYQTSAKQVYQQFLLPAYCRRLSELLKETRKASASALIMILDNREEPVSEISIDETYAALLGHFFEDHRETLNEQLKQSGIVFSLKGWKIRSQRRFFKQGISLLEQAERTWRVTFYALFEDLRFRENLLAFIQEVKLLKLEVSSIISGRIRATLHPELDRQKANIDRILEQLPDPETATIDELKSYLVKELYHLNKEKKIQEQDNTMLEAAEGIPGILQKLESMIVEQLEVFPSRVAVVRAPDYEKGIKASEISYFSPREFLEFSSLAKFLQVHKDLQADLARVLARIVREFKEFEQIIDFYLDSAIALTQKPEIAVEEVVRTFREGINRLEGINAGSKEMLVSLEQERWSEISGNTDTFIDSVRKLDDNDKIINIYTHLLKSKALASSVQNRQRIVSGVKNAFNRISKFTFQHSKWLRASYEDIRKRLRLTSASAVITSEISNYLAGIHKRITQLPVIYQHLFEPAPVKEMNLFLSREEDTSKLDQALSEWGKGNFAATLVTGENGSGCSSLLQHYARTVKSPHSILYFKVDRFYSSSQDFYTLIGEIFSQEGIRDENSLGEFMSGLSEKIVIIDGLERLFMRKVNGFECLRRFLSLIVNTDDPIFWICSVSKIAFQYLGRTVAIAEHFDYILDIDHLKGSDIREIIMKRNRLSGYDLHFQNSVEEAKEGSEVSQEVLEEAFFTDLEKSAGSNIRLSLIYWLQSVESIDEAGIKVGKFSVPDFEFLDNLEPRKAFVLLLVVMHGKITEHYHTLASNCTVEESSSLLSILKEDSILNKKDEYYFLNGILYRHVVKLLKDRNLIH